MRDLYPLRHTLMSDDDVVQTAWQCRHCTFINEGHGLACDVCELASYVPPRMQAVPAQANELHVFEPQVRLYPVRLQDPWPRRWVPDTHVRNGAAFDRQFQAVKELWLELCVRSTNCVRCRASLPTGAERYRWVMWDVRSRQLLTLYTHPTYHTC